MASEDLEKNKFKLSANRFLTINEFKNKVRVDIREFYINDAGEKKPGKKGISLSLEEWNTLKEHMDAVDQAIKGTDDSVPTSSDSDSE